LYEAKIKSLYELIEGCLSTHHFYRFVAFLALDEYQSMHEQKVEGRLANQHYLNLIKILLEKVQVLSRRVSRIRMSSLPATLSRFCSR
jgi:cytidylate kinase